MPLQLLKKEKTLIVNDCEKLWEGRINGFGRSCSLNNCFQPKSNLENIGVSTISDWTDKPLHMEPL